jgi:hypothetical protein
MDYYRHLFFTQWYRLVQTATGFVSEYSKKIRPTVDFKISKKSLLLGFISILLGVVSFKNIQQQSYERYAQSHAPTKVQWLSLLQYYHYQKKDLQKVPFLLIQTLPVVDSRTTSALYFDIHSESFVWVEQQVPTFYFNQRSESFFNSRSHPTPRLASRQAPRETRLEQKTSPRPEWQMIAQTTALNSDLFGFDRGRMCLYGDQAYALMPFLLKPF